LPEVREFIRKNQGLLRSGRLEWHCHRLSSFCGCGASHHLVAPIMALCRTV
jgi:hypothetical protein